MAETGTLRLSDIIDPKFVLRAVDEKSTAFITLVESIRKRDVLTAILVRPTPEARRHLGPFELIAGLHRKRASLRAGKTTIPAIIRHDIITDEDVLAAQVEENAQGVETRPVEYARHLKRLREIKPDQSVTTLAANLHKSIRWVYDMMGLLKLAPSIQTLVDEGDICVTNAWELARLPVETQKQLVVQAGTMKLVEFRKLIHSVKRKNRHAWQRDRFTPLAVLRTLVSVKSERRTHKAMKKLLAMTNAQTQLEAVDATLDWVMRLDPVTLEKRRQKHEGQVSLRQLHQEHLNEVNPNL